MCNECFLFWVSSRPRAAASLHPGDAEQTAGDAPRRGVTVRRGHVTRRGPPAAKTAATAGLVAAAVTGKLL